MFARTACFNADVAGFYDKWLADLSADQQPKGQVPHVVPNVLSLGQEEGGSAAAGWADAALIVPWTVYLSYGDTRILEQQYESMKGWVDYMALRAGDTYFWNTDYTFGDWLAYATDRSDYPGATTSKDLITQAYFAHSTDLLIRTAKVLGRDGDVETYSALLEKIKDVFVNEFITPNGRVASNTQTAYALALAFDLVPDSLKNSAARRLAEDVRAFKHITTGFLGTPQICHVLGEYGYHDEAFMLLNRTEYPSWLYPITKNATTIWERWDGIKPDGSFQNPGMNSFNHYAYGAIGDWLYRVVAGIEIDEQQPGYKHIIIQPHPGGGLEHVKAEHHSLYGAVASEWSIEKETFTLRVKIPANTTATLLLPKTAIDQVTESGQRVADADGVIKTGQTGKRGRVQVGSGEYVFKYAY
ncbi:MAG: alpha-L-rhamnosidase C-terminal domain-containing protein [candidate division KSB1 bacterium]|nr:alpha-L-rhamnosidase C-terminal domain-containing protein [candidate division KSB1 bacterium]